MIIYRPFKKTVISQLFGENKNPAYKNFGGKGHNGVDFALWDGDKPLYFDVSSAGTVWRVFKDRYGGIGLDIITEDKDKTFLHRYWHLKGGSIRVQPEQKVETGDYLGISDNTGLSTGTHLHRGLKPVKLVLGDYKALDPDNGYFGCIDLMPYFEDVYVLDKLDFLKKQLAILRGMIEVYKQLIALKG